MSQNVLFSAYTTILRQNKNLKKCTILAPYKFPLNTFLVDFQISHIITRVGLKIRKKSLKTEIFYFFVNYFSFWRYKGSKWLKNEYIEYSCV